MKVLQLCIKPPYPPVDGGTLAMDSVTQGLLAADCEVRVLTMCSEKHPMLDNRIDEDYRKATRIEAVPMDLGIHAVDAAVAMLCGESYNVKRFESRAFAEKLGKLLVDEHFDVVHLESLFLTPYVPLIRSKCDAVVVLRAHNVEHKIWQQIAANERRGLKRWYLKHLSMTLRAYESEHLNDYDGVVCITDADTQQLKELGCRKHMVTVPFGMAVEASTEMEVKENTLFHIGSMDWMPNQEGVRWFLDQVWPSVVAQVPQARLHLAGRRMPDDLLQLKAERVVVDGEVPDSKAFIADKQINIVPLLSGSGMRVKIIEAMSMGKTVISTTVGAKGIECHDGQDIIIADTSEEFVNKITECMTKPGICQTIGQNAQKLIAEQYDNRKLVQRLIAFYEKLSEIERV